MTTYAVSPESFIPVLRKRAGELAVDFSPVGENPFLFFIDEVLW